MVLWENEYFVTSNLLYSFISMKLCPLILLHALIVRKISETIFSFASVNIIVKLMHVTISNLC